MRFTFLNAALTGLILSASCVVSVANAGLINGGFESGLTGWEISNAASTSVVESHEGYTAQEGSSFLLLLGDTSAGSSYTISQTFQLEAGDIITGFAAYDWNDYSPFYDHAAVKMFDNNGSLLDILWSETGNGLPDYDNTPWAAWSFTSNSSSTYKIEYSAGNSRDALYAPQALFDGAQVIAAKIPEPSTLAIFALGLMGLASRRFKKQS